MAGRTGPVRERARIAAGMAAVVLGLIWTAQGVGLLGGSPMTGRTEWAVIGPVVALVGLALTLWGRRDGRRRPPGSGG